MIIVIVEPGAPFPLMTGVPVLTLSLGVIDVMVTADVLALVVGAIVSVGSRVGVGVVVTPVRLAEDVAWNVAEELAA
jgi:hypothetical protein